jgi:membrane protease YdiL (CAAX protease family)
VLPAPAPQSSDPEPIPPRAAIAARLVALLEVLICSDVPTQVALAATFAWLGFPAFGSDGQLQIGFVVGVSLVDTVVLVGLIVFFLHAHGEAPRDVLFGSRRISDEVRFGVPLTFLALAIGVGVLVAIQYFWPSLHTVPVNPIEGLLTSPRDAWLFAFVAIAAGGIREEVQRAFLLHRFEVWGGGGWVGLILTSTAFGAAHVGVQGYDAGIVTGLLGAMWGVVYLKRRSAIAPIVSHAGFDLLQILQYVVTR